MPPLIDLTGRKFERLLVTGRADRKGKQVYWNCICDCGNEKVISGNHLKNGHTRSCGCIHTEVMKVMNLKNNKYELVNDSYYKITDGQDRMFLIDKDDFHLIEGRYWRVTNLGYVFNSELRMLHRLIMNTPKELEVDHINHDGTDNRRCNLRNVTHAENCWNFKAKKNWTKTGHKGVSLHSKTGKYRAVIFTNGSNHHIGVFDSLSRAIESRIKSEENIRGLVTSDWSDNH